MRMEKRESGVRGEAKKVRIGDEEAGAEQWCLLAKTTRKVRPRERSLLNGTNVGEPTQ